MEMTGATVGGEGERRHAAEHVRLGHLRLAPGVEASSPELDDFG
jgi:hypothetical protein